MDLAEGHLAALKYIVSDKNCCQIFNLGSGIGFSVIDILNAFRSTTGSEMLHKIVSRRKGDIAKSVSDIRKAKNILGWSPKRNLSQMCSDSWNWQTKNLNGYG